MCLLVHPKAEHETTILNILDIQNCNKLQTNEKAWDYIGIWVNISAIKNENKLLFTNSSYFPM